MAAPPSSTFTVSVAASALALSPRALPRRVIPLADLRARLWSIEDSAAGPQVIEETGGSGVVGADTWVDTRSRRGSRTAAADKAPLAAVDEGASGVNQRPGDSLTGQGPGSSLTGQGLGGSVTGRSSRLRLMRKSSVPIAKLPRRVGSSSYE